MLKICGRCEYRLENIPSGCAESAAQDRGATISKVCLQVCMESAPLGVVGVNFEDKTIDDRQTGTIVIGNDGIPNGTVELYRPVRLTIDFSNK